MPLESSGTYNFTAHWGDGTHHRITKWNQSELNHSYSQQGEYEIKIIGEIVGFRFDGTGDRGKIIDIRNWGPLRLGNNGAYFKQCFNLYVSATDVLNLTGTTNLEDMFNGASSFNGDLSGWDVSSVTNMENMFKDVGSFTWDLSGWDVNGVSSCSDFNLNTTAWSISNQPSFSLCTP